MNESPYRTPVESASPGVSADLPMIRKNITFWIYGIWISIVWIVVSPMIGLLVSVIGMRQAFSSMGSSGIEDPSQLSAHIGRVLIATVAGLALAIPGIPALIVSIIRYRKWKIRLRA